MKLDRKVDGKQINIADSWGRSYSDDLRRSARIAWITAAAAGAMALLLSLAIVFLLPLKTVVPYTLLVDRQTGYVEQLAPLDEKTVTPETALTRAFLAQYVIARESYDASNLQRDYRKVALWSEGAVRQGYVASMNRSNPESPVNQIATGTRVQTSIKSVSSLSPNSALVRFATLSERNGGQPQVVEHWAAVINYHFSDAEMTADDRLVNPLGFQVTRYRRDQEALPEVGETQFSAAETNGKPSI